MSKRRELSRREQLIAILRHGGAMTDEIADLVTDKFADEVRAEQAAEIDRLRRENELHRMQIGELCRGTERMQARIAELERPAIEARRNKIRSTYTELISQAEQDRDFEGASTLALQLRESEAKWAAEDAA